MTAILHVFRGTVKHWWNLFRGDNKFHFSELMNLEEFFGLKYDYVGKGKVERILDGFSLLIGIKYLVQYKIKFNCFVLQNL